MTTPIIKVVNISTGEEYDREMTAEELAQYEAATAAPVTEE